MVPIRITYSLERWPNGIGVGMLLVWLTLLLEIRIRVILAS